MAILILFQSCVAYTQKPATPNVIEEASKEDIRIKITTANGNEYKLNWIECMGTNIYSITNTNRINIDKQKVVHLSVLVPEPQIVSLEQAFIYQGSINVLVQTKEKEFNDYQFIKVADQGDMITGYSMAKGDTLTLNIPIDQIEKLKFENKSKSAWRTAGLTLGLCIITLTAVAAILYVDALDGPWETK